MEKCIGCELCAGVCPADCIYVRGLDNPPDHPVSPGERYGYVYEINFLRCIHCDLCVEACPTEAITESKLMEFSFTNRNDAIYTKDELLVDDDGKPKHLPWEDWREGDDLHTSGWMRATSPSGSRRVRGTGAVVGRARASGSAPPRGASRSTATTPPPAAASCARPSSAISSPPTCPPPSGARGGPSAGCWRRPSGSPPGPARSTGPKADAEYAAAVRGRERRAGRRRRPPSIPGAGRGLTRIGRPLMVGLGAWPPRLGSGHASWVDVGTFAVAAAIILAGAVGVVVARNPVHSALMLVMTLFGVAVLFVLQRDPFLAAVQVIVYAGAIVVLFLFVIMFLGVDREEDIAAEPLRGQRPLAIGLIVLGTTGLLLLGEVSRWTTGAPHVAGVDAGRQSNVYLLGKSVYTTYLFPFEATAALLVIAVVGAVVLARRPPASANPLARTTPRRPSAPTTGRPCPGTRRGRRAGTRRSRHRPTPSAEPAEPAEPPTGGG